MARASLDLDHFSARPSAADEETVSLFSGSALQPSVRLSNNTGFTEGTGAFRGAFSSSARWRMLDKGLDEYIIKQVIVHGKKDSVQGKWSFEKDGIVVIANSPDPGMEVLAAWFHMAFRTEESATIARDEYERLLEELDSALDDDDRLERLDRALSHGWSSQGRSRVFHGIDLGTRPRNLPFAQHLAERGYANCLKVLVDDPDFRESILTYVGSNRCNALHRAAWGGHQECVDILCGSCPSLASQANKWKEYPELAAFNRGCEVEMTSGEAGAEPFKASALQCLRTRTGDASLGQSWFQDQAREALENFFQHSADITVWAGTRNADLVCAVDKVSEWKVRNLQVNCVHLGQRALQSLLTAASTKAPYLQHLTLSACGLSGRDVNILRNFVEEPSVQLVKLDLSSNPLADSVVDLFCPRLYRATKDLNLGGVGLTHEAVRRFSDSCGTAAEDGGLDVCLDTIRFAYNDLSEVGDANFGTFALLWSEEKCPLTQVFLDHTRLQRHQLLTIVNGLPNCRLTKLSCHGLCIPPEWANESGQLYKALKDPACMVKKFEVDVGHGSGVFDKLWKAIKLRDAAGHSRNLGQAVLGKGKGKGKDKDSGAGQSGGPHALAPEELCGSTSFNFREPFETLLSAVVWDPRRCCWLGKFITRAAGVLHGVCLEGGDWPQQLDKVFQVTLKLVRAPESVDRDRKGRDLVVDQREELQSSGPFLRCCRMVFVRESDRHVLLLKAHFTAAAQELRNLWSKHFPLTSELPLQMKPQVRGLLSRLSDRELAAIIEATPDKPFSQPLGQFNKFRNPVEEDSHRALLSSAAWVTLMSEANTERQSRSASGRQLPEETFRMLVFSPSCQLQSGGSTSQRMSCEQPVSAFVRQLHRTTLSKKVKLVASGDVKSIDVLDVTGRVQQKLLLCMVPDAMIESNYPWLVTTSHDSPLWVPLRSDMLAEMLHDEATEGFPNLCSSLCSWAREEAAENVFRLALTQMT